MDTGINEEEPARFCLTSFFGSLSAPPEGSTRASRATGDTSSGEQVRDCDERKRHHGSLLCFVLVVVGTRDLRQSRQSNTISSVSSDSVDWEDV
jgi:hypothetical protein